MTTSTIVVGIDVGGPGKGFHAVALDDGDYFAQFSSLHVTEVADWCRKEVRAKIIGVDAPCHWSKSGKSRFVERELMKKRIWCFSTPSRERAENHPKKNFDWMLAGEKLFQLLKITHPLFTGAQGQTDEQVCFETFPHAIECALAGKIVSAKDKHIVRRELLERAGMNTKALTKIDTIDAALCALTAHYFEARTFDKYGDATEGVIVVPACLLARQ